MKKRQVLVDCGEIHPRRKNVLHALRRETNLKCLLLTILIAGSAGGAFLFCSSSQRKQCKLQPKVCEEESHCDDGLVVIPTAFILTLYLVYLVECWHSKAREMISPSNKADVNTVYWKIESMRRARPVIWWKALCFHFVSRAQHVSRMKDGTVYTSWKKVCSRINTHQVTCSFFADACGWRDISRNLVDLERHAVTIVHFHKNFIFANSVAAREFQRQRELFSQELVGLDDYIETTEVLDLNGVTFPSSLTCWNRPDDLPWFARVHNFWIISALLLSWPMRIILEMNTAHVHYHVTKLFGANYEPPSPGNTSPAFSACRDQEKSSVENVKNLEKEKKVEKDEKELLLWESSGIGSAALTGKFKCVFDSEPFKWKCGNGIGRSVTLFLPKPSYKEKWEFYPTQQFHSSLSKTHFTDLSPELVPTYSEAQLFNHFSQHSTLSQSSPQNSFRPNSNFASVERTVDASHWSGGTPSVHQIPTFFREGGTFEKGEPPPDYFQALETSRPVWIPFWTRLRRCQTERNVGLGQSNSWTAFNEIRVNLVGNLRGDEHLVTHEEE